MQIFLVIFQICLFPKTLSCCLCTPMQMFLQYFSFAYFHGVSFCLFQSMGRQGLSAFMHQGIWSSAKLLPCLEFKIGFTWKSCLRPLKVEVHRSTISTDDFHWETILKLLSIWFLQWKPCLYDLGPIFCDGWSLPISHMGVSSMKAKAPMVRITLFSRDKAGGVMSVVWGWLERA